MKQQVRTHCRNLRRDLCQEELSHLSRIVCQRAISLLKHHLPRKVASYIPLSGEVSVEPLNSYILHKNGFVLLPRIQGSEIMSFHRVGPDDQLVPDRFGLWQPHGDCPREDEPHLLFIPGMAFDESGNRIGYGKGYYDRFLSHCPRSLLVGLTLERFLFPAIPTDEHDKKVHIIITETSILGGYAWNL